MKLIHRLWQPIGRKIEVAFGDDTQGQIVVASIGFSLAGAVACFAFLGWWHIYQIPVTDYLRAELAAARTTISDLQTEASSKDEALTEQAQTIADLRSDLATAQNQAARLATDAVVPDAEHEYRRGVYESCMLITIYSGATRATATPICNKFAAEIKFDRPVSGFALEPVAP